MQDGRAYRLWQASFIPFHTLCRRYAVATSSSKCGASSLRILRDASWWMQMQDGKAYRLCLATSIAFHTSRPHVTDSNCCLLRRDVG